MEMDGMVKPTSSGELKKNKNEVEKLRFAFH